MSPLHEALGIWPPIVNPWFWILHCHQPILFSIGYGARRFIHAHWKDSRILFFLVMCSISIFVGWTSCMGFRTFEDHQLEHAIAQYHNPPQRLMDYHIADGGRNFAAAAFGGVYAVILLVCWSPVLLLCWFYSRHRDNRHEKNHDKTGATISDNAASMDYA